MKDSLIEIKNNLQGNNNRVDEVKNPINVLQHKEMNKQQQNQNNKKKKESPPK